ncbi:MAG: hypothetical protein ACFFDN_45450, partial [Candidatus Hodarchaeota archaeon]
NNMKAKKFLFVLILNILIIPCIFGSFTNAEIEWQVNEGSKLTWIVQRTNESLGFLPVNSRYEMTITSIKSVPSMGSGEATELYVNLTVYNSVTTLSTQILNNETFSTYDSGTNTSTLYTYIDDHCFLIPPDYVDGFIVGLDSFYSGFFDYTLPLTTQGVFTFSGYDGATELLYMWMFNGNYIADNLVVVFMDTPSVFEYWLVLQQPINQISIGNYFLIFAGLTIVSLLYLYKKKLKIKSLNF